ncbi:MAG: hypothetical protein OEV42_17320 [Deltaproteobacteria bacterium]|nr:hypothetical protein [Deltaproteobacteria bacterium]
MVKVVKIAIALVSLAVAGFFIYSYFMSDEKKVIKRLVRLSELVSKEGEEPAVIMAGRIRGVGDLFAETCRFSSDARNMSRTFRPDEITSHTASARANFLKLSIKFYDMNVSFPGDKAALVSLTAILSGVTKSEALFDEIHELEVELVHVEKKWLIRRITAVEVLEK